MNQTPPDNFADVSQALTSYVETLHSGKGIPESRDAALNMTIKHMLEHLQFQLENNEIKGDWLQYVAGDVELNDLPNHLGRFPEELLIHIGKVYRIFELFTMCAIRARVTESPLPADVQRYFLQLMTEYLSDTVAISLFAMTRISTLSDLQEGTKAPPISEDFMDERKQAAIDFVYEYAGIPNPMKGNYEYFSEVQQANHAILTGQSTAGKIDLTEQMLNLLRLKEHHAGNQSA